MERRQLGNSTLTVTPIGLGAWAIGGGDWMFGWGPQNDAQSIATIRRAVERGINWIDTAAVYGLGHSETVIARALRGLAEDERPLLFTACSLVWDELGNVEHSLSPVSIRREVEASLRRLEVDYVDLYQIGWPANPCPNNPAAATPGSLEDAWETMASLQREGKARFIGISNCNADQLVTIQQIAPVTSLQVRYSLMRRDIDDRALAFCEDHDIAVLASSPMESGLLTGTMTPQRVCSLPHNDWRRCNPSFQAPALTRASQLVERLRDVGTRHDLTPGAVAVAWTLRHPAVTAAIVGARQPQQIDEIVQAASSRLTSAEMEELVSIHSAAPR